MSSNKNLAVADFDGIKTALRDFLQGNAKFSDYNFEGSALSVLLDLLAYNSHHNAMYTNLALNEMFLDSAVTRGGVVSRTHELGYTPRSARAATAIINATITGVPVDQQLPSLSISRGTRFKGTGEGGSPVFFFVVTDPVTVSLSNGAYVFDQLPIKQGTIRSYKYAVDRSTGARDVFEIPHDDVDTSTIRVSVQASSSNSSEYVAQSASNVYKLDGDAQVFFIQEQFNGKFAVVFGDGVIGKKLDNGNIVKMEYLVTEKTQANGIKNITSYDPIGFVSAGQAIVTVQSSAYGGDEKETIASIKANAPAARAAQNRIVTANDLKSKLINEVALFDSVNVWGGEDNEPPIYGKVFISAKPKSGFFISNILKAQVLAANIKPSMVVSIQPEFVDPDYTWVSLIHNIRINPSKAKFTTPEIGLIAKTLTTGFFASEVEKFTSPFIGSRLTRMIHDIDSAIISSQIEIQLYKRFYFIPDTTQYLSMTYGNAIEPFSVKSQAFIRQVAGVARTVIIQDLPLDEITKARTGSGKLVVVDYATSVQLEEIGTIDYVTGAILILEMKMTSLVEETGLDLKIAAVPQTQDIYSLRNQLIVLDNLAPGVLTGIQTGLIANVIEDFTS